MDPEAMGETAERCVRVTDTLPAGAVGIQIAPKGLVTS